MVDVQPAIAFSRLRGFLKFFYQLIRHLVNIKIDLIDRFLKLSVRRFFSFRPLRFFRRSVHIFHNNLRHFYICIEAIAFILVIPESNRLKQLSDDRNAAHCISHLRSRIWQKNEQRRSHSRSCGYTESVNFSGLVCRFFQSAFQLFRYRNPLIIFFLHRKFSFHFLPIRLFFLHLVIFYLFLHTRIPLSFSALFNQVPAEAFPMFCIVCF